MTPTNAQITEAPAANITTDALEARLLKRMNSSAAAAAAQPQTAATTPGDDQNPEAAEPDPNAPAADPAQADPNPEETPGAETPEGATPEEATPEGEPTGDPNAEPTAADSTPEELDPEKAEAAEDARQPKDKAVRSLLNRVHKVVDQRDMERNARLDTERRLQEAQQRINELEQGAPAAPAGAPPAHPELARLDADIQRAEQVIQWAESMPEGGEWTDGQGKTHNFTAQQVAAFKRNAENDKLKLVSSRAVKAERLQAEDNAKRATASKAAQQAYPWLAKKDSPEFQVALQIGRQIPGILQCPEFQLIIGDATRGRMLREAQAKTTATPPKPPPMVKPRGGTTPTPVAGRPAAAAPRTQQTAADLKVAEAEKRYATGGGRMEDYQKLVKARLDRDAAKAAA